MEQEKFYTQVSGEHYQKSSYNDLARFISYYYQIKSIRDLPVKTVLEIGSGNGLVANYLKSIGLEVKTCDFDARVKPDIVADVRSLPLPRDSFDVIAAYEILEHIPYEDFKKVLIDLKKIAKKYVVISVPHRVSYFELIIKFPFIRTLLKRDFLDFTATKGVKFNASKTKQHCWEMDERAYKLKEVRKEIEKHFEIIKEFSPILDKYHYFFILEIKDL